MPQQSDRTSSSSVILVVRRPQSLACGDPCGAPGIDPVAQPEPEAMTPLTVRCDPHLPNKMRQREHRDEATGVLPATFLNEAIRNHPDRRATAGVRARLIQLQAFWQRLGFAAGDEGGIMCKLDFGPAQGNAIYTSLTHLHFDPRLPLARDITAYQKHRVKRIRRFPS